jgi:hypothetical protein
VHVLLLLLLLVLVLGRPLELPEDEIKDVSTSLDMTK